MVVEFPKTCETYIFRNVLFMSSTDVTVKFHLEQPKQICFLLTEIYYHIEAKVKDMPFAG